MARFSLAVALLIQGCCISFGHTSGRYGRAHSHEHVTFVGETQDYFGGLGFQCPPNFNPADYFIDLLSHDTRLPALEHKSVKRVEFLGEQYQQHEKKSNTENGYTSDVCGEKRSADRSCFCIPCPPPSIFAR